MIVLDRHVQVYQMKPFEFRSVFLAYLMVLVSAFLLQGTWAHAQSETTDESAKVMLLASSDYARVASSRVTTIAEPVVYTESHQIKLTQEELAWIE